MAEGAGRGGLLLTFDVGRILVGSTPAGLFVGEAKDRGELSDGLTPLDEEEPWWRLLGHPLTAVWPGDAGDAVAARSASGSPAWKLRFREETENPRTIRLQATASGVRAFLEE